MSGKLVGLVLDAAESGQLDGLSRPAFHALIAIAERCLDGTQQGYAHSSRIQAAIRTGNSPRSVKRAVRELKDCGLVRVVQRGYRIPNGESRSNLYELTLPAPRKPADVGATHDGPNAVDVGAIQGGPSVADVGATLDGPNDGDVGAKYVHVGAKYVHVGATQDGPLDGIVDGIVDGGRRACAAADLPPPPHLIPEPNRYCPKHPYGTNDKCGDCGTARVANQQWAIKRDQHSRSIAQLLRQAIDACNRCDDQAWHLGPDGGATNIKCQAIKDYR